MECAKHEEREEGSGTAVEGEAEAEGHATQGACVRQPGEAHRGSLIVCATAHR